jgi:hypothetical protein
MKQEMHPQSLSAFVDGFEHARLSKRLQYRVSQLEAASKTAPYDGGARVSALTAKVGVLERRIQRNLEQSALGATVAKSAANKISRSLRNANWSMKV